MSENKYPLWCCDHGEGFGEERYHGPYDERHRAEAQRGGEGDRVRRCRRIMPSELPLDAGSDDGGIISELDTLARGGDLAVEAWADITDPVVLAKVSTAEAVAAFWAWADAHLQVEAFVCEGDELGVTCVTGDPTGGGR